MYVKYIYFIYVEIVRVYHALPPHYAVLCAAAMTVYIREIVSTSRS